MFKKFLLKDIIFLAIFSAALLLVSSISMPIVMFTQIFALRQLLTGPIFGLFMVIALYKVPKPGTILIIGIFTGLVLLFMSPIMFYNNVVGAILVEIIGLILGGFDKEKVRVICAGFYIPCTLPITLISNYLLKGKEISLQLGSIRLTILIIIGTIILSFLGAFLGQKIAKELKKAGKLS